MQTHKTQKITTEILCSTYKSLARPNTLQVPVFIRYHQALTSAILLLILNNINENYLHGFYLHFIKYTIKFKIQIFIYTQQAFHRVYGIQQL